MKNTKTRLVVLSALLAAVIALCTRFTSIPIFGGMGYVHIGDAFIFLAAAILPTPYAILASACGGALADLMSGFVAYILPTAIIKALMALAFAGKKREKLLSKRNFLSIIPAIVILVGGYYVAEVIMYQSFISPLIGMVWNLLQGAFSAVGFAVLATALDKTRLRDRIGV